MLDKKRDTFFDEQQGKDRWWWCDALFMGPPVLAKLAAVTDEKNISIS